MPKLVYTAAKGLVQEDGSGIDIETADGTCSSNALTVNGTSGVISLEAATVATGAVGTTQTITNNRVTATSTILLDVDENGHGTKAGPMPILQAVSAGSFTFKLGNVHGSASVTAGQVKISYLVL